MRMISTVSTVSDLSPGISSGPRKRATTKQYDPPSCSGSGDIPSGFSTLQRRWKRRRRSQWQQLPKLQPVIVISIGMGSVLLGLYWLLVSVSVDQTHHNWARSTSQAYHQFDQRRMNEQSQLPTSLRKYSKGKRKYESQGVSNVNVDPMPRIAIKFPTSNITAHIEPEDSESGGSTEKDKPAKSHSGPDYGGLEIMNKISMVPRKELFASYAEMLNEEEEEDQDDWLQSGDEDYIHYYAFDDDFERGRRVAYDGINPENDAASSCRRVAEHRMSFPTCNELHQLDYAAGSTLENNLTYLNHGAFRDVFSVDHSFDSFRDKIVIKEIRYELSDASLEMIEYVRMDAIVAERLASSPRTFDVYGYCGLSLLSEFFHHGDIQDIVYAEAEDKVPDAITTPEQKLVLALEMAESLADLHGNSNGMIIHGDVQLGQFLLNNDKTLLKLNDFNRAEFLLWDDTHQAYCQHRNGKGHGSWRAPEEYRNDALTDKVDVWSLANNMYVVLTGEDPDLADDDAVETSKLLIKGKTGRLDPKYFEKDGPERILAQIIQRCYQYDPSRRPTIFEIVKELEQGVQQVEQKLGITRQAILQQL